MHLGDVVFYITWAHLAFKAEVLCPPRTSIVLLPFPTAFKVAEAKAILILVPTIPHMLANQIKPGTTATSRHLSGWAMMAK